MGAVKAGASRIIGVDLNPDKFKGNRAEILKGFYFKTTGRLILIFTYWLKSLVFYIIITLSYPFSLFIFSNSVKSCQGIWMY